MRAADVRFFASFLPWTEVKRRAPFLITAGRSIGRSGRVDRIDSFTDSGAAAIISEVS